MPPQQTTEQPHAANMGELLQRLADRKVDAREAAWTDYVGILLHDNPNAAGVVKRLGAVMDALGIGPELAAEHARAIDEQKRCQATVGRRDEANKARADATLRVQELKAELKALVEAKEREIRQAEIEHGTRAAEVRDVEEAQSRLEWLRGSYPFLFAGDEWPSPYTPTGRAHYEQRVEDLARVRDANQRTQSPEYFQADRELKVARQMLSLAKATAPAPGLSAAAGVGTLGPRLK